MEEIRDFLEWVGGDQQEGICVFSRVSAPTGQVGGTIRDAPRRVSAVSLRVSEALAALALHGAFWIHVRLHRQSQAAEFGD